MSKKESVSVINNAGVELRIAVIHCLLAVLEQGKSLTVVLEDGRQRLSGSNNLSALNALCYGVLRWHDRLSAICEQLLNSPLRKRDRDLRLLMLIAMFQLMESRTPSYAVVDSTVNTAVKMGKAWAKGLVNGVLRNFIRRQTDLIAKAQSDPAVYYAFPSWLFKSIKTDWPEEALSILEASNIQAPMFLRVNTQKISRDNYIHMLTQQSMPVKALSQPETAVCLSVPCDVTLLPGFQQGLVSVQDAAAQYAALLLAPQAGERILDACAAPGGKTSHLLEMQPDISCLTAVDIDSQRLQRVQENLQRLIPDWENKVVLKTADLSKTAAEERSLWWDGRLFDKILLDVPCSATGVIRRHPDIKYLRRAADIQPLCRIQEQILRNTWPALAPGGRLLYVSCSILKCENEVQVQKFLSEYSDAELVPVSIGGGQVRPVGCQILPQRGNIDEAVNGDLSISMDGFYYALLQKRV